MPAAMVMAFFRAPPNSTPTTSSLVYTRKLGELKSSCTHSATVGSWQAMTVEEGLSSTTSRERLGPERTQTRSSAISGSSALNDLGHGQAGVELEALDGAEDHRIVAEVASEGGKVTPQALRGGGEHHEVRAVEGGVGVG